MEIIIVRNVVLVALSIIWHCDPYIIRLKVIGHYFSLMTDMMRCLRNQIQHLYYNLLSLFGSWVGAIFTTNCYYSSFSREVFDDWSLNFASCYWLSSKDKHMR